MELLLAVGMACLNAAIVLLVLVSAFGAPELPVLTGCVWAVVFVYILWGLVSRGRPIKPK